MTRIGFLGGVGTVTGSNLSLEEADSRTVFDVGMVPAIKRLRLRNRVALPVDPSSIGAAVAAHVCLARPIRARFMSASAGMMMADIEAKLAARPCLALHAASPAGTSVLSCTGRRVDHIEGAASLLCGQS